MLKIRVVSSTCKTSTVGKHNSPAVKSNESPGKKKPKNIPFSAKIINNTNAKPPYLTSSSGLNKSQKLSNFYICFVCKHTKDE